jgi:hypothetical protein
VDGIHILFRPFATYLNVSISDSINAAVSAHPAANVAYKTAISTQPYMRAAHVIVHVVSKAIVGTDQNTIEQLSESIGL